MDNIVGLYELVNSDLSSEVAGRKQNGNLPEISYVSDRYVPKTLADSERPGRHIQFYLKKQSRNGFPFPHETTVIGLVLLPTGQKEVYCLAIGNVDGKKGHYELPLSADEKKSIGTLANALFVKHIPGSTREESRMLQPHWPAYEGVY